MLARLYIRDFALIEEAEIEFGPGLNIITGETGTGKSILLGALNSILGGPASADLVRAGAGKCTVEGFFEFAAGDPAADRLATLDAPLDDGQLILRRDVVIERLELLERVYEGDADVDSNSLEVIIGRLRRKIGATMIETVRGRGYRLICPAAA